MKCRNLLKNILIQAVLIILCAMPIVSLAEEEIIEWELVNPEGVVKIDPIKINMHPSTLQAKTVMLRWNAKHNGDKFLNRVAELLTEQVKDIKIIKAWEVLPETNIISQSPERSKEFAKKIAAFKPDLVIGSQAD